jgi:hypothetical protein
VGSVSTTIKKGTTLKEFFRSEFGPGVLDVAVPKSNEAYIAYQTTLTEPKTGRIYPGPVICIVVMVNRSGNTITYKDMDEGMHPYFYNCPIRIFKMLSPLSELKAVYAHPTTIEGAKAWRAEVMKHLKIKK